MSEDTRSPWGEQSKPVTNLDSIMREEGMSTYIHPTHFCHSFNFGFLPHNAMLRNYCCLYCHVCAKMNNFYILIQIMLNTFE